MSELSEVSRRTSRQALADWLYSQIDAEPSELERSLWLVTTHLARRSVPMPAPVDVPLSKLRTKVRELAELLYRAETGEELPERREVDP